MNILELREEIQTFLETLGYEVHYQHAPQTATFPYIVFDLVDSTDVETREDFNLEVDVWDNIQNTTRLETLVGNIDGDGDIQSPTGLNRKLIFTDNNMSAKIYRTNRLSLPEPDITLRRRQLRYDIQTYL